MILQEILNLFNSPLSHEQTWAVGYILTKSVHAIRTGNFAHRKAIRMSIHLDTVALNNEGEVEVLAIELSSKTRQQERDLISSIGDMLCRCLNYGLGLEDMEKFLIEDDMAELIGRMVLQSTEDRDEGFDDCNLAESWSSIAEMNSFASRKHFQGLEDVMYFCEARLVRNDINGGLKHYENVCKALYAEAEELKTFLYYISTSGTTKQNVTDKSNDIPKDHNRLTQWAKLWLSVMKEIRMVSHPSSAFSEEIPKHYELTPAEVLRQRLKTESEKMLQQEKDFLNLPENARELVVDFLIKRLESPVEGNLVHAKRKLTFGNEYNEPVIEPSKSQLLLEQYKETLNVSRPLNSYSTKISRNSLGSIPVLPEVNMISEVESGTSPKKVLHVPTPLKFENWSEKTDNDHFMASEWAHVANDPTYSELNDQNHNVIIEDRRSLGEEIVTVDEGQPNITMSSGSNNDQLRDRKRLSVSSMCLTEIDIEDNFNKNGKLGASFLEICKTRQELTRAETEIIVTSNQRAKDIKYGKICFGCKKTKFGLLTKSRVCEICRKKFCTSCILLNNELSSHLIDFPSKGNCNTGATLSKTRHLSLSFNDLSLHSNITPFPCRGQSTYDIGSKKTAAGPLMSLCKECKCFVESIMTETRNSRWQVRLQLDL